MTEEEAKAKEKELIKKYKSKEYEYGYNCTFGGDGTVGLVRTQEAIQGTIDGNSKPVYQYSTDGNFIKEWKSAITIERELGYSSTCIVQCCLGNRKQAYGYIWRHNYTNQVEPITIGIECNPIHQYSLDGKFIKSWESGKQIEKELGFYSTNIYLCCNGGQISAYGFLWSYDKKDCIDGLEQLEFSQYDFDGNYIKTFNSISEASHSLGHVLLPIHKVCRGEYAQAGGYMWRYGKEEKIEPYNKKRNGIKKVYQYTKSKKFIKEWESVSDASKSFGSNSRSTIINCIKGRCKSAYGYLWTYEKGVFAE